MAYKNNDDITRVILWATPRSMSTAFLKCMTYVPDTQAWYEPYLQCFRYWDKDNCDTSDEYRRTHQAADLQEDDVEGSYVATNTGYSWLRGQLESTPSSGQKMIFCKDIITWPIQGNQERLPAGTQHTFITRNPYAAFYSFKKGINSSTDSEKELQLGDLPPYYMPDGWFYRQQYDLYKYAKETLGQNPPVVDADELLANPAGVMKAYFKAIGIPYKDEYLKWEQGDKCMDKRWIMAKEIVRAVRRWQAATFQTTCFGSPKKCPSRDELPIDVVQFGDLCIKYYDEMYANRLKPL